MNGKPEKSVHIVDKAVKAKEVNKKVTEQVFRKNNQISEWDFIPRLYLDALKGIGSILLIPMVLIVATLEGIRTGVIRGLEKALAMYQK